MHNKEYGKSGDSREAELTNKVEHNFWVTTTTPGKNIIVDS